MPEHSVDDGASQSASGQGSAASAAAGPSSDHPQCQGADPPPGGGVAQQPERQGQQAQQQGNQDSCCPQQQQPAGEPRLDGQQPAQQPEAADGQPATGGHQQAARRAPQQAQQAQQAGRPRRQVLVLGAGYDTAFFQLAAEGVRADKYVEIDFLQVRPGMCPQLQGGALGAAKHA